MNVSLFTFFIFLLITIFLYLSIGLFTAFFYNKYVVKIKDNEFLVMMWPLVYCILIFIGFSHVYKKMLDLGGLDNKIDNHKLWDELKIF